MQQRLAFLTIILGALFLHSSARAGWRPDGVALSTAVNADQDDPAIVSDGVGGAIVVWTDSRPGAPEDIYAQRVDASGVRMWMAGGVAMSTAANNQYAQSVVSDGAGGAIVAWQDDRRGEFAGDIYVQRVNAAGVPQWTANGVALWTGGGESGAATIASDGVGGAIVTWVGASDIYAQRVNAAGVPQWTIDGVALCTEGSFQNNPTVVSDGAEGAIVSWEDYRGGSPDIYAQRVSAAGVPQWTTDGVALCGAANGQFLFSNSQAAPRIVADGAGGAIVTWMDERSGTDRRDVYAQRVDASGVPQWTTDGVALCTAALVTPYQFPFPTIASDGAGGAIVTWDDFRSHSFMPEVFAQRVDAAGVPQWTADGVALCTAAGGAWIPTIVSDDAGGAIVTWRDLRFGERIYAQRVNTFGVPQWTADGVALCTTVSAKWYPTIASDGAEGGIVAWTDDRGSGFHIYAQHVAASGDIPTPQFAEVGAESGTDDSGKGHGVAWGDYDGDGDLDIYLANYPGVNRLYRNNGDGAFTEVGVASGTVDSGGRGGVWGDYDNDGDLDLYLSNGGVNRLYRNNGNGTFTEVGAASGTADGGNGEGVAWGDYDNDGDLDLYVANTSDDTNRLYRNNDDGTFTDVGAVSGTDYIGNSKGVAWGDYDNDGDLDLDVANWGSNRLYRNNGDGTFADVGAASGTDDAGLGTGVAWGDYDNDGDLDLYHTNAGPNESNRLYRNNGDGTFTDVGAVSGTDDSGNSMGVAWGDYDNDGDLDLYVAKFNSANRLYRNNGDATFSDVGVVSGTDDPGTAWSVAWGDYDSDGDLDLYLVNYPYGNYSGENRLFRNDSGVPSGYHWLHVDLVGTVSNRSGIGARVRCVSGGTSQIREISGGSGYLSQNSLTAEFGLGTAAVVDTIEVRWPSGIIQKLVTPGIDQRITVTEAGPTAVPEEPMLPRKYALYANVPNPFNPVTVIRFDLPSEGDVHLQVYDVGGRLVRTLVNEHRVAGVHRVQWDGFDQRGQRVSSGVYFYRLVVGSFVETRKMVLLK